MPGIEDLIPRDPVELTLPFAYALAETPEFDVFRNDKKETDILFELNVGIRACNLIGDYRVRTNLAFVVPENPEPDKEGNVTITRMDLETGFRGTLMGGRTLKIGQVLGQNSVRALCLAFEDTRINYRVATGPVGLAPIPIFEDLEYDERLYVPVLAVTDIEQAA